MADLIRPLIPTFTKALGPPGLRPLIEHELIMKASVGLAALVAWCAIMCGLSSRRLARRK
jgi:hypothetical protein